MTCPKCRLVNPSSAMRCDCGYDFETGLVGESFLSPREQALNQARPINPRASGTAFAAAAVVVVIVLGLARLSGPKGPIGGATYVIAVLGLILVAVGGVLLVSKTQRADAGLPVAVGLGAWVGLYAGLAVLL
jgi:hypothetical protein